MDRRNVVTDILWATQNPFQEKANATPLSSLLGGERERRVVEHGLQTKDDVWEMHSDQMMRCIISIFGFTPFSTLVISKPDPGVLANITTEVDGSLKGLQRGTFSADHQ